MRGSGVVGGCVGRFDVHGRESQEAIEGQWDCRLATQSSGTGVRVDLGVRDRYRLSVGEWAHKVGRGQVSELA